jgi:hypothetical protein
MASHHLLLSLASFVFSGELVFLCGGCFVFLFSLSWCSFCFVGFCLLLWWFVGVGGPSPTVAGPPPLLLLRFGVMLLAGTAMVVVSCFGVFVFALFKCSRFSVVVVVASAVLQVPWWWWWCVVAVRGGGGLLCLGGGGVVEAVGCCWR